VTLHFSLVAVPKHLGFFAVATYRNKKKKTKLTKLPNYSDQENCCNCRRRLWTCNKEPFNERIHLGQTVHFERILGRPQKAILVHIGVSDTQDEYKDRRPSLCDGQTIVRWLQYEGYTMTEDSILDVESLGLTMLKVSMSKRGRKSAAVETTKVALKHAAESSAVLKKGKGSKRRRRACFLCGFAGNSGSGSKLVVHLCVPFNSAKESNYLCRKCEKSW
jgi:hypothetical protein